MTDPIELAFTREGQRARVVRGGEVLLEAGDWGELIAARPSRVDDPMRLARGTPISIDVSSSDWPVVMSALAPESNDEVREIVEESDSHGRFERPPIDMGITINGESWGWLETSRAWCLVPLEFLEEAEVLVSLDMQWISMVASTVHAAVLSLSGVSFTFVDGFDDGSEPGEIDYGVEPVVVFTRAIESWVDDGWAVLECPFSSEDVTVDIAISPSIPDAVIGASLARMWTPASSAGTCEQEIGDRVWRWREGSWIPATS